MKDRLIPEQCTLTQARGSVLFVGLVFLVVLTAIGATSMRVSTQQERMTGNFRDRGLALESAESAMREAERKIGDETLALVFNDTLSASTSTNPGLIGPLCEPGDPRRWQNGTTADCALCTPSTSKITSLDPSTAKYACPDSGACWICGSFNWNNHSLQHGVSTYGTTLEYISGQNLPQAARYVIEELKVRVKCSDDISLDPRRGALCVMPVRRITTRGTGAAGGGGSDAAAVVLQETYFPTR